MTRLILFLPCLILLGAIPLRAGPVIRGSAEIPKILELMRKQHDDARGSGDAKARAKAWLGLQRVARRLEKPLRTMAVWARHKGKGKCPEDAAAPHEWCPKQYIDAAAKAGLTFVYDPDVGKYYAGDEGYREYLKLAPDGDAADEAVFYTQFHPEFRHHPDTPEQVAAQLERMRAFREKYPRSPYAKRLDIDFATLERRHENGSEESFDH